MGHILDMGIKCFRVIRVQLPNKSKFAKLRPCCQSLEKHLHFSRDQFLIPREVKMLLYIYYLFVVTCQDM